jgi:hypothetical protein
MGVSMLYSRLFVPTLGLFLIGSVLGGCASTAPEATRSYTHDAGVYRVEIEEYTREDGTCLRRRVVFTAEDGVRKRHLDEVRAIDRRCDAKSVRGFDSFEILRTPGQQEQYARMARFRRRVDAGLWSAYQAALRRAEQVESSGP